MPEPRPAMDRYVALLEAFEAEHGRPCASYESTPEIEAARHAALAENVAIRGEENASRDA